MERHQLAVVHLVDVIAGQDDHDLGPLFFQRIDVLVNGVGRALIPLLVDPLLGRHDVDEFAQLAAKVIPPAQRDVPIEAHRLVLREHHDPPHAAVETVREREVDDPVNAAKRHRRLRPVARQRPQPRALSPSQYDGKNILHRCVLPPRRRITRSAILANRKGRGQYESGLAVLQCGFGSVSPCVCRCVVTGSDGSV